MCGIFGFVGNKILNIKQATDVIKHRGPDAEGFLQYYPESGKLVKNNPLSEDNRSRRVLFGFRRLSIIDLHKHSNQPFSDPSEKYHLIFNGEIYNYLEIKTELEKLGVQFKTQSDTEVLLKAYIQWGTKCVQKFNGMWAFAILDIPKQTLFCSRDRFGIKPFFYYQDKESNFYFASEIKQFFSLGIEKVINPDLIKDLIEKWIADHTSQTFFKNIFHLPAGHILEIPLQKPASYQIKPYWTLEEKPEFSKFSYSEAKEHFKALFLDSVKLRFRSDVPVGSCLSGGLDSSSIVSSASTLFDFPIQTFTSRFDIEAFDETRYADLLPQQYKNVHPNYCQLTESLFEEEIDTVIYHQDEPFTGMGVLAQWEVMKLAKQNGVTVLLDGQGGDEILAGYRKFYAFFLKEKLSQFQFGTFLNELYYLFKNKEFNFFDFKEIRRYLGKTSNFDFYSEEGKKLNSLGNIGLRGASTMNGRSKQDIEKFSYPLLLRFEDRNSMASSIETRVPFMDYRVVEFLYSIPSDFKIRKGYTKAILRDSLNGILPDKIRTRINKLGFATPQDIWMANGLKPYFLNHFQAMKNPWLDSQSIVKEFQKYPNHTQSSSYLFFTLFCFDKWYQKHFQES